MMNPDAPLNSPYCMQLRQAERQLLAFALECSDNDHEHAAARLGITAVFLKQRCAALGGVLEGSKPVEPAVEPITPRTAIEPRTVLPRLINTTPVDIKPPAKPTKTAPAPQMTSPFRIVPTAPPAPSRPLPPKTPRPSIVAELREPPREPPRLVPVPPSVDTDDDDVLPIEDLVRLSEELDEKADLDLLKLKLGIQTKKLQEDEGDAKAFEDDEQGDELEDGDEEIDLEDTSESPEAYLAKPRPWESAPTDDPDDNPPDDEPPIVPRGAMSVAQSPDPEKYCTYRDVTAITGLSVSSVHYYRNTGKLTAINKGGVMLFARAQVEAIAKERAAKLSKKP